MYRQLNAYTVFRTVIRHYSVLVFVQQQLTHSLCSPQFFSLPTVVLSLCGLGKVNIKTEVEGIGTI